MPTFCSIVTPSTHAQARVMADSVRLHHPSARALALLISDAHSGPDDPWESADLPSSAAIPELLEHALASAEVAVFLEPDVCVYGELGPLLSAAVAHGVALVPRVSSLPDDGLQPDYAALLDAGEVSPAIVAVARGEPAASFLAWWSHRRAESDISDGRWLTLASEQLPSIALVTDPGCGVSPWNLHERPLKRAGDRVVADNSPLRAFHFGGFRADRPYWLSEHATRVRVIDDPVLSELCGEYAERVLQAGWAPPRRQLAGMQRLGNGQRIDHLVRALWSAATEDGSDFGDPLSGVAADAFVAWMRQPAKLGGQSGVNRYLYAAYLTRPDLQREFPDLDSPDGGRLVAWAWQHGRQEVLPELLPTTAEGAAVPTGFPLGVNVIGYLGETLGLAEAARSYIAALSAAGVPVTTTAVALDLPVDDSQKSITRYGSRDFQELRSEVEPAFNLACLNGDHLAELIRVRGDDVLQGLPTIGQWGWETDVLPASWTPAFEVVDEVWVYSRFMAENLGRLLPMPVVVVPPAIVAPDPAGAEPPIARDDRFTFVFMLDFFSTLRRKNALGLVEAFTRAFVPDEGPRLVLKTINARFRPEAADELRHRAGSRSDIEFFDEYLDPAGKAALLQRADCYVSLHRSEGFGLPLAESMSLGTPVIATGYSGNTDFTTPHNSYLVDWKPTRVGPDCEIYPPDGMWAEPDLDHAAELMRHVWEHPNEAKARGARAQADIQQDYAPAVTGAIARGRLERLDELGRSRHAGPGAVGGPGGASVTAQHLDAALSGFDLRRGQAPAPSGLAGLMRRSVLRLMLPFTFHEREVDRSLVAAIRDLESDLGRERARGLQDRARLRRLEAALDADAKPTLPSGGEPGTAARRP
jgi:glycosyltransferase involved in cell wall biosynthesis